ncbi:hypothetical protein IW261DRAFT_1346237 [Armillaria novae-zelandiae]|uniref:CxC2-like cysteine cluster KDZ transposase-associated domain-containing protein n=1 Tax=Armillaria novae-zelandiae TaxID=153914 RepID=A0AA39TR32_9AGAR|nr:hypothetical protein IW261DRAFT_1346237 [Armillaria novae-zelandiae]
MRRGLTLELCLQGVSKIMKEFRPKLATILDHILASESNATIGEACCCGGMGTLHECMCNDCQHHEPSCKACFIAAHLHNPWHWAEVWNGSFFDRQDISKLGRIVIIGHNRHQGVDCPYAIVKEPVNFHMVHINGIHKTKVLFYQMKACLCSRIFPGTVSEPHTRFTFAILQDFHLQTLTSKKLVYNYISAIRRKTNNAFSSEVPDVYSLFLQVQQIWIALMMYKWGGQVHNMDKYFPSHPTDSVVVPRFSCPERGFNVMDTIMETISNKNQ